MGNWSSIVPQAMTNFVINPSAERDLGGWGMNTPGGFGSVFERVPGGRFGGWCFKLRIADGQAGNFAVDGLSPIGPFGGDTVCTFSAWIKYLMTEALAPVLAVHDNGPHFVFVNPIGDGEWHRTILTYTAPAGQFQVPVPISDARTIHSDVLVDGIQFEIGPVATDYCDGDQPGCEWLSTPHASTSLRHGQEGRNGLIVTFDGLGLDITSETGLELQAGNSLGARVPRAVSLTGEIAYTSESNLESLHRGIITALNPDTRAPGQSVMLRYTGGVEPRRVKADAITWIERERTPTVDHLNLTLLALNDQAFESEVDDQTAVLTYAGVGAGVTTVVNNGTASTFPVIVVECATTPAKLFSLGNFTTIETLTFSGAGYALTAGEFVVFDFRVGHKTVTSWIAGTPTDISASLVSTAALATFHLAPGTNAIVLFATPATSTAVAYWRPRNWSAAD